MNGKYFFVWRVTYICVHVTQVQILPTSSKHVSDGMRFLGLGIGGLSHQSCMSLHIGTNGIVGGSINDRLNYRCDNAARCRGMIDAGNGLQRNKQGHLQSAQCWGRDNDALPEIAPVPIFSRVHRSMTLKSLMLTASSCTDNSWRSTTLSLWWKLTSWITNLEWCLVHFICDLYITFNQQVFGEEYWERIGLLEPGTGLLWPNHSRGAYSGA